MKLPKIPRLNAAPVKEFQPKSSNLISAQGCDIGCLISKAPQCVGKIISGDIPGAILCAGSAAAQCGCF